MVLLLPKYWGIWIAIVFNAFGYFAVGNPMASSSWLSKSGLEIFKISPKTTIRNLEVCFPEWSAEKVQQQAKQVL